MHQTKHTYYAYKKFNISVSVRTYRHTNRKSIRIYCKEEHTKAEWKKGKKRQVHYMFV